MKSLSIKSERGSSLIEVLVVMVVLVVGIFTVIRIFPVGFDLLQYTGNASIAHRLADSEVEFWRKNAENLPDAVVAIAPGPSGRLTLDPIGQRPNDFVTGTGAFGDDPGNRQRAIDEVARWQADTSDDAVDRWVGPNRNRRIIGEVARIPAPSPVQGGVDRAASVYSLSYAPIEWTDRASGAVDPNEAEQYIQISGTPLSSVDVTGMAKESLYATVGNLRAQEYGIDYAKGLAYFPKSDHPRQFIANYSYRTTQNELKQAYGDRLIVPTTSPTSQLPGSVVPLRVNVAGSDVYDRNYAALEPNTDSMSPKFRYLVPSVPFSSDPYEYKVLATSSLGVSFTGAIAFNPAGYNQMEPGLGNSRQPLRARIDYTVKDWRILHQDVTLPAQAPYRVRLALPFLKQAGVTMGDNELQPWAGLTGRGGPGYSVVAVDLADGSMAVNNDKGNSAGFLTDYRTGTLNFPARLTVHPPFSAPSQAGLTIDPAGHTYRIFYAVEGDWSVIPQKPFANYKVAYADELFKGAGSGDPLAVPIGEVALERKIYTDPDGKPYVRVLFPVPDEGASVAFDFAYRDNSNSLKTVYGQDAQVSSEARQTSLESWYVKMGGTNSAVFEVPKPYAEIYLPRDAKLSGFDFANDFVIKRVQGTSFRSVVVWRDRSRWRMQAVTAFLTRPTS